MKSRNSIMSKVKREELSPNDDEQVKAKIFLRDPFRIRMDLIGANPDQTNPKPVLDAILTLHNPDTFQLLRAKDKLSSERYPKQIIFNF